MQYIIVDIQIKVKVINILLTEVFDVLLMLTKNSKNTIIFWYLHNFKKAILRF